MEGNSAYMDVHPTIIELLGEESFSAEVMRKENRRTGMSVLQLF